MPSATYNLPRLYLSYSEATRRQDDVVLELWDDGIQVHDCNLVNNAGDGIRLLSHLTNANAENNWWGDAAGPTGPNGDGVSGAVDYTPWRTAPYVLPYVP